MDASSFALRISLLRGKVISILTGVLEIVNFKNLEIIFDFCRYFQMFGNNSNDYLKIFDDKMLIHGIYEVEIKCLTDMIMKY